MSNVTIYTSPTCVYCHRLKDFLNTNNVEYSEVDVQQNPDAAQRIVAETGQMGVPVTDIDGTYILGFAPDIISEKLNLKQ